MKVKLKKSAVERIVSFVERMKSQDDKRIYFTLGIPDREFEKLPENDGVVLTKSQLETVSNLVWGELMAIDPNSKKFNSLKAIYDKVESAAFNSKE